MLLFIRWLCGKDNSICNKTKAKTTNVCNKTKASQTSLVMNLRQPSFLNSIKQNIPLPLLVGGCCKETKNVLNTIS